MAPRYRPRIQDLFPIDEGWAEAWSGMMTCWRCDRFVPIFSGIELLVGGDRWRFNLAELDELDLFEPLREGLGPIVKVHRIARRRVRPLGREVYSNGCVYCGAHVGEFFELKEWAFREKIASFDVRLDAKWRRAMLEPGDARERVKLKFPGMPGEEID